MPIRFRFESHCICIISLHSFHSNLKKQSIDDYTMYRDIVWPRFVGHPDNGIIGVFHVPKQIYHSIHSAGREAIHIAKQAPNAYHCANHLQTQCARHSIGLMAYSRRSTMRIAPFGKSQILIVASSSISKSKISGDCCRRLAFSESVCVCAFHSSNINMHAQQPRQITFATIDWRLCLFHFGYCELLCGGKC